ncbi:hypothetical protein [Pontibacter vulgaris]|uniref:hypothetical protein n=1 Tax=Pontibacter vulgaris TaxID=2905679 RepID=UPI001FA7AEB6|nr:hypothetical protein [Pontibacter vulgaris]
MRRIYFLCASLALLSLASCDDEGSHISPDITDPSEQKADTIKGAITENLVLKENATYYLKGQVYVKNNATLTIPAGVTVLVGAKSTAEKGGLVVKQGAKLFVNGTAQKPVVFTSAATAKTPGDWAGIVLLGKAPTNLVTGNVPGLPVSDDTKFGGDVAGDNSGAINYLRLEYCGGLNPDAEDEWETDMASGLSLFSVGSATKVEHVMVRNSRDDAFQFVGGTVNAKYLIGYNNGDDDFDFDRGYTGKLQYIISYRTAAPSAHALRANGMESLNDKDALGPVPHTRPVISNMTILGPQGAETTKTNLNQGVYIRKATRFAVRNSIVAEYPQGGLMVCMKTRPILLNGQGSEFMFNLVHSDNSARAFTWDLNTEVVADEELTNFATNSTNQNTVIQSLADLKLKAPYAASAAPDFSLQGGAAALTGANFSGPDYSTFFTTVAFRGAVGTDNWAAASNWASWK